MSSTSPSRRQFLRTAAAVAGFPTIVPASVFGQNAPSNRITMAVFGWGMQGPGNTNAFMGQSDCEVVAACDVDAKHLEAAVNSINKRNGNQDCKGYKDFREVMARKDIDTVMLALPDHWHAIVAIEAARNGKDIYGEKPLARTVAEQQAIVRAVEKHGRIWQTGSWQRSQNDFRIAAEIVRNGLIGKLQRVEVGLPGGHSDFGRTKDKNQVTPPPEHLDYEFWIGPAQMEPYIEGRIHKNWRWNYNIGGGQLLDWIGHHCDIAHWGMDRDDGGGPTEIRPVQVDFPPADAMWNTATKYRTDLTYDHGVTMTIAGGHGDIRGGTKWIGSDGWVWVNRGGYDASKDELKKKIQKRQGDKVVESAAAPRLGDDVIKQRLYDSPGHQRNFLDSVKSRKPTVTPVATAHRAAVPGHLSLIALTLNRTLKWDPVKEEILGDAEASKLLGRTYRGDWKLG
jgi:predicted dehydrogenase